MAVFRRVRRRLRQMNPCTSCLVVTFIAVVFYLISAIRGIYVRPSAAVMVAEGHRDSVGPGYSGNHGGPAGQRRRRKDRTGSFIVGDDDIQLCTVTSTWASTVVDQQDYLHLPAESAASTTTGKWRDGLSSCSAASANPVPTLFYVDADGLLKFNRTAAAGGKYELVMGSCTAWKIEWNLETGYVEKNVSLLTKVDTDFIRVSCRVRRNIHADANVDGERRAFTDRTPSPRRRSRSEHRRTKSMLIADMAERRARQMHRDQLRRRSPHFVGTVGLPDPPSNVVDEQKTSSHDASESEEQATENELQHRRDEQTTDGFESDIADQSKPTEHAEPVKDRELANRRLSRSERDLKQSDERDGDDNASTEDYDQWIARIHPLNEVVDREGADDDSKSPPGRLDVLVLALESVSSISFHTDLPKSRRFLVDQPHTVMFTGYNVLGDAAPANIIPMLTGLLFS